LIFHFLFRILYWGNFIFVNLYQTKKSNKKNLLFDFYITFIFDNLKLQKVTLT